MSFNESMADYRVLVNCLREIGGKFSIYERRITVNKFFSKRLQRHWGMKTVKMKKQKKWIKIILIVVAVLLLFFIGVVAAFIIKQYNATYEPVDIVKRPDTYIMPDYPQLDDEPGDDAESIETEPVDTEPVDTEPVDAEPVDTEPVDAEPVDTEPVDTEPVDTEPVDTEPVDTPTTDTQPSATLPTTTYSNSSNKLSVYKGIPIYEVKQKSTDIVNILLLGTDSRDVTVDRGRSDTMIVVSYNKKSGEVKLVSLLRDSLVPIEGYDWNRLNTAYIFGGVGLAINTINQLFDLDIQRFIVVDMDGVCEFIDHIGGVDVTLTQEEVDYYNSTYGKTFTAGVCHLNADEVMKHIRNRAIGNDFGRTKRQRDVITTIVSTILKEKSLSEILELVEYTTSIVSTNIDMITMTSLVTSVVSQKNTLTIETHVVPFTDAYKFAWYNKMSIVSFDIADAATRLNALLYEE